jgi:hypothetical protein
VDDDFPSTPTSIVEARAVSGPARGIPCDAQERFLRLGIDLSSCTYLYVHIYMYKEAKHKETLYLHAI